MSNSNAKFLTGAPHAACRGYVGHCLDRADGYVCVDFVDMIFISMLGNAALAAAIGYAGSILVFHNILWDCDCGRCLGCTGIGIR